MSRGRMIGVGALGALGGLLSGLVLQDLIATVLVTSAGRSAAVSVLGAISSALLVGCTAGGVLVACWSERRRALRPTESGRPGRSGRWGRSRASR